MSIIKRQKDALSNFFTYENRLKKHMNRLKKQVQALLKHKNRFFAVYNVFSKDDIKIDFSIIKKCIFYAPDHIKEYSTVSLLRENGILEI